MWIFFYCYLFSYAVHCIIVLCNICIYIYKICDIWGVGARVHDPAVQRAPLHRAGSAPPRCAPPRRGPRGFVA